MKMIVIISTFFLLISFGSQVMAQDLTSLKKRIAIINFEDKAGYGHNVGQGVSDMLVTSMVESEKFVVIEREELDEILKEQGLGQSGLVTPQSAAKVGQLLGIQRIITGSITEFGSKKNKVGGGIGGFNIGVSTTTARVAVDLRIINVNTGEITMAKSAEGEDSSTGLDNEYIVEDMEGLPWEGKIIKASGTTIYMKPGSKGGVQPGMEFAVYRPGEELIDPDTGISLGSEEAKI